MTTARRVPHSLCISVCLIALGLLAWTLVGPSAEAGSRLDEPIVVTQVPRQAKPPPSWDSKGLVRSDWFDAARLVIVSPDGQVRVLSEGFQSACDPNVSFDGRHVLFAAKQQPGARWRIWEIGLDGQGARPVSPEHLDARSPIHATTLFTLDSPEPWLTTLFVAREPTLNEVGRASASSLYNVKLDGTELRRLTFNPNHNFDPFQMWDGRVIYSAERYPNQPGAPGGHVGLYAIHVEGADMERYGGERAKRIQQMPCATERGLVVFVESDQAAPDGAGQLAGLEEQRPHLTYRPLTKDRAFVFLYPSPLEGNRLLVSRRPASGKGTCGVFSFDADQGRCEPLFDRPDYHDVQAVLAAPRKRPDGHSTVVDTKFEAGILYGLNCYDADPRMAPHVQPGMVKRVRLIEGVLQSAEASLATRAPDPFVARRLVGEAPVEADGSFNLEVPADTPLLLQTLDDQGMALANCGWIWVKPKEKRGCIGCHEDPERVPENEYVLALRRPSNRLVLPPADRRAVSFRADIAPVLRQHCATADCHGGKDTPLHLPLSAARPAESDLRRAYSALLAPAAGKASKQAGTLPDGTYVDPGRARTSWLLWQLTGRDTSRPWDHPAPPSLTKPRKVTPMPPSGKAAPLTQEQLRTFVQWIDLGAPYEAPQPPVNPQPTVNP